MKIRLNENEKVVKMVKEGLKKKNGLLWSSFFITL